jgi:hypothetical protein
VLTFTAQATDQDRNPAQTLTYSLEGEPAGATIDPQTGLFTWAPTDAQARSGYSFTVRVTDDGEPALSDSQTVVVTAVSAVQDCAGYRSPSSDMLVSNSFAYAEDQTLESLAWTPLLPDGWTLNTVAGDGAPSVADGRIVFAGPLTANPVVFAYTVNVPGSQAVSNALGAAVSYRLAGSGVDLAAEVPLLAVYRYHSADYRSPLRQIDSTEMSRVLSYWRAGGYVYDVRGYDGYVATNSPGAVAANRHSADWLSPSEGGTDGKIDTDEVALVQDYWRAGGYHVDPEGEDGYSYNREGVGPRVLSLGLMLDGLLGGTSEQAGPVAYNPGQTVSITNTFVPPAERLLSLYWRFTVPSGWTILSAAGDGAPVLNGNDVLLTAAVLPSTPISLVCQVQVPLTENRVCAVESTVKYKADGMVRATTLSNAPLMTAAYDADPDGDRLSNYAEYLCGTVPTDAQSVLKMVSINPTADGSTEVSWSSVAGRVYTLQRADGAPAEANFRDLVTGIDADPSGRNVYVDTPDRSVPHFYRVILQ